MRARLYVTALLALGLGVRLVSLFEVGMVDMGEYFKWGRWVGEHGLTMAYGGIYFPLQWQLFHGYWEVGQALGGTRTSTVFAFKLANLLFDVGTLILVAAILRRWKAPRAYALVYWCHPWFLALACLGYVDVQYAFFAVLAAVAADRSERLRDYLLAGVPLGLAFVMKPQTQVLMVGAGIFAGLRATSQRDWRPLGLFAGPASLFLVYACVFWLDGELGRLIRSYVGVADVMPALSAQMPNVWQPLAFLLEPNQPIWTAPDTLRLFGWLPLRLVAIAWTLACLALWPLLRVLRPRTTSGPDDWTLLFTHAALVLPMLMTSAHENHLFLGSVLLVPLLARAPGPRVTLAIHGLLAVQCLNIVGIYGLGRNPLSRPFGGLMEHWAGWPAFAAAIVGSVCFFVVLGFLFELARGDAALAEARAETGRPPRPELILAGCVLAVYALAWIGL